MAFFFVFPNGSVPMAHRLSDCTVKVKTQYNTVFLKLIFFQNSKTN